MGLGRRRLWLAPPFLRARHRTSAEIDTEKRGNRHQQARKSKVKLAEIDI